MCHTVLISASQQPSEGSNCYCFGIWVCAQYCAVALMSSASPAIAQDASWKWKWKCESLSRVRLSVTPWTVARQAPLFMGFSRQEYQSGLPFPSPGNLPNPGIKPRPPALQADSLLPEPPGKPHVLPSSSSYDMISCLVYGQLNSLNFSLCK